MIDVYSAATPNGYKVTIALEELALPYQLIHIHLFKNEQKTPEFLRLNPNGRIPVIVDRGNGDLTVFESGAILLYLAERTGKLLPTDQRRRWQAIQWLMFQMGGIGPMMGQANVFFRYFEEKIPAAIGRYHNEVKRLFGVLDGQLKDHEYLAEEYSVADIANWAWVRTHNWSGVGIDEFSNLKRWKNQLAARPACIKGISVPPSDMMQASTPDDKTLRDIRTIVVK